MTDPLTDPLTQTSSTQITDNSSSEDTFNFKEEWNNIKELVSKEKKVLAFKQIVKLEQEIEKQIKSGIENSITNDARWVDEQMKADHFMVTRTKFEGQEVIDLIKESKNEEGWTLAKKSDGIDTYFRMVEGSHVVQLKMNGIINAPAIHVLACMNEIDLWNRWLPTVHETDTLLQMSPFSKIMHIKFKFPLPLSVVMDARDAIYYVYGVDVLEEKTIAAIARNPKPEEEERLKAEFGWSCPPIPPKHIRMEVKFGGMVMYPINNNSTRLVFLMQCDPKVKLPTDLINWGTKKFAYLFYIMLRKQTAKLDKIYIDRIEGGSELYKTVLERAVEWIEQNPEEAQKAGVDLNQVKAFKEAGNIEEFRKRGYDPENIRK